MPDTKPCVFCGKTNDFLMTCEGVCLECGDKLQSAHGLIIMMLTSYRALQANQERLAAQLSKYVNPPESEDRELVEWLRSEAIPGALREACKRAADRILHLRKSSEYWERQHEEAEAEIERLREALAEAASSLEWIFSADAKDHDRDTIRAYARSRSGVARVAHQEVPGE